MSGEPPVRIPVIDGAGQALRSAIALAAATGRTLEVEQVLHGCRHPGVHSQNQVVITAAAEICGAEVEGNDLHAERLVFRAGPLRPGDHVFDVGSAGSAVLLLLALVPALALADGPSVLTVHGGTDVPFSPPYCYLEDAWLPTMEAFGARLKLARKKPGFFPRGHGEIHAEIEGGGMNGVLHLGDRGDLDGVTVRSITGNLPFHVGERQLKRATGRLQREGIAAVGGTETLLSDAPGTIVQLVGMFSSGIRVVCSALGRKGETAEDVADRASEDFLELLRTRGNVDQYAADHLLVPFALAGAGGQYVAPFFTSDLREAAEVVNTFFPGRVVLGRSDGGGVHVTRAAGGAVAAGG